MAKLVELVSQAIEVAQDRGKLSWALLVVVLLGSLELRGDEKLPHERRAGWDLRRIGGNRGSRK